MTRPIVLASTSPYRRELLGRLGIPFEAIAPRVDEAGWERDGLSLPELACRLAQAKAQDVAARRPDAVVIGSDQICAMDGIELTKPGTRKRAIEQLSGMAGGTHELLTAVTVVSGGHEQSHLDVTRVTLWELSRAQIERYVYRDRPLDCAGAYKMEGLGISLMKHVETQDPTAIVGLPLIFVCQALRSLGVDLP